MSTALEDRFVVFLRSDLTHADRPDAAERDLIACETYAEARRVRRQFQSHCPDCVIRFVGPAGGGD